MARRGAKPTSEHDAVFARLRAILAQHAPPFTVVADTADRYCLEGAVGPATLRAWGGRKKRARIPVAWVEIGKSYVSFHLMVIDPVGRGGMSNELEKHMHGKTCFNFTAVDDRLFDELAQITSDGLAAFRKEGFVE